MIWNKFKVLGKMIKLHPYISIQIWFEHSLHIGHLWVTSRLHSNMCINNHAQYNLMAINKMDAQVIHGCAERVNASGDLDEVLIITHFGGLKLWLRPLLRPIGTTLVRSIGSSCFRIFIYLFIYFFQSGFIYKDLVTRNPLTLIISWVTYVLDGGKDADINMKKLLFASKVNIKILNYNS